MAISEERPLQGKHAVITGGGRGIGAAIADSLSRQGVKLTLMGRNLSVLETKAEELADAQAVEVDVCAEKSVQVAFQAAVAGFGSVDILVNNAGAAASSPLHNTSSEQWHAMMDVNLNGVFYCCREVVASMKKTGWGRIINISSIAGLSGAAYISAYCAAKHGAIGLTRALALELARTSITVNAICPGYTNTELLDGAISNIMEKTGMDKEAAESELKSMSPQNRFIEPEEVAATVKWLCQPGSEGVNGHSIPLTGGGIQA